MENSSKKEARVMATKIPVQAIDDPSRVDFLAKREKDFLGRHPELEALRDKLLSLGGDFVVYRYEPDLKALLERGLLFPIKNILLNELHTSQCHSNVASMWSNTNGKIRIATGWALSDDGLWRQHSWGWDIRSTLIETTEERLKYFGFILDEIESMNFAYMNA